MRFDLNVDVGELESLVEDGTQAKLLECATSVNICCGAHAGSEELTLRTLEMARGLKIGAHPGYPDRERFGRVALKMSHTELVDCILSQLMFFGECGSRVGIGPINHVKVHGALYNSAVGNRDVAEAIAEACGRWDPGVKLVGLGSSLMLDVFRTKGFEVLAEGFADRVYERDRTLRSRQLAGSLITDPEAAAEQAVRLASCVDTICVHSDSPGAVRIAAAVRSRLDAMSRMEL